MEIRINRVPADRAKKKPEGELGFGKIFTDHMLIMEYHRDRG